MERIVILGTGTGVGKTHVGCVLSQRLVERGASVLALKPVATGVRPGVAGVPDPGTDAALLEAASFHVKHPRPHPYLALPAPISPHLAAEQVGIELSIAGITGWIMESEMALHGMSGHVCTVIETAGGAFTPLSRDHTQLDLAVALEPATWILVVPDRLGVLHDTTATLEAMKARARLPDHVVLRAPLNTGELGLSDHVDASAGTNASELHRLGIVTPSAVLHPDDDHALSDLARRLLRESIV